MFERDFMLAFNKYLNEKKDNASKTYAEVTDRYEYTVKESYVEHQPFQVKGDDKLKSQKWDTLLKDCCFYYDKPTIQEER